MCICRTNSAQWQLHTGIPPRVMWGRVWTRLEICLSGWQSWKKNSSGWNTIFNSHSHLHYYSWQWYHYFLLERNTKWQVYINNHSTICFPTIFPNIYKSTVSRILVVHHNQRHSHARIQWHHAIKVFKYIYLSKQKKKTRIPPLSISKSIQSTYMTEWSLNIKK